jgi:poly-beta-1,6-N-acetyl-D-glucosamine synthase
MAILGLLIILIYSALLYIVLKSWQVKQTNEQGTLSAFSIIIPVRNESRNITACLTSLINQSYPQNLFEIIVIDDHSEDDTVQKASTFGNIKLINQDLLVFGKKMAIKKGVEKSQYDNIVTLDGDCVVGVDWLLSINQAIGNQTQIATGIVVINREENSISEYEYLDTLATMAATQFGITKGYFYLANGCNLFFKKEIYNQLLSSDDHKKFASGDDVFLMKKGVELNAKIIFLNDKRSAVFTNQQDSYYQLVQQRKRWATKTKGYSNLGLIAFQGIVFSLPLFIVVTIVIALLICKSYIIIGLAVYIFKLCLDYIFLNKMCQNIDQDNIKKNLYLQASLISLAMTLYMGFCAILPSRYLWKGRKTT